MPGGEMTEKRGPDAVELRVAARLENLAILRTLVGAVGTFADLDLDSVADLRLAVDEACTLLIRSASPGAALAVVVDPRGQDVVVEASAVCDTDDVVAPGSLSWMVMSSLTDAVQVFHDGARPGGASDAAGRLFGITLTTRRAGASR